MNLEEIKIGETYYVRVKADSKDSENVYCQLIDADGNGRKALSFYNWMLYSFLPVPSAPKQDPCRLFKKGDKVRLVACNGRPPYDRFNDDEYVPDETIFTVMSDEWRCGDVDLYEKSPEDGFQIHFSNLELVTHVEELEPYYVEKNIHGWIVYKNNPGNVVANFNNAHPHAKEAAEAERDRLNDEYRKEANNG